MDSFSQRKKDVLSKKDKSSIGNWDKKIIGLCDKINSLNNYYTTSSCSGRVIIMKEQNKKTSGLFAFVSHEVISLGDLKKILEKLRSKNIEYKFKFEPAILHIACKTLEDAEKLFYQAKIAGWKRASILSINRKNRIVIELSCTEKLEFPIIKDKQILVSEDFLRVVVVRANSNFKNIWIKIQKLIGLI